MPNDGDRAFIVQHPDGQQKRLGFVRNMITAVTDDRVQYLTDTQPGSSGAPVFDARRQADRAAPSRRHADAEDRQGAADQEPGRAHQSRASRDSRRRTCRSDMELRDLLIKNVSTMFPVATFVLELPEPGGGDQARDVRGIVPPFRRRDDRTTSST